MGKMAIQKQMNKKVIDHFEYFRWYGKLEKMKIEQNHCGKLLRNLLILDE